MCILSLWHCFRWPLCHVCRFSEPCEVTHYLFLQMIGSICLLLYDSYISISCLRWLLSSSFFTEIPRPSLITKCLNCLNFKLLSHGSLCFVSHVQGFIHLNIYLDYCQDGASLSAIAKQMWLSRVRSYVSLTHVLTKLSLKHTRNKSVKIWEQSSTVEPLEICSSCKTQVFTAVSLHVWLQHFVLLTAITRTV